MKLEEFYGDAVLWTCYIENFSEPERYLNIHGLNHDDVLTFEQLGMNRPTL
jgi:hypothetical protein